MDSLSDARSEWVSVNDPESLTDTVAELVRDVVRILVLDRVRVALLVSRDREWASVTLWVRVWLRDTVRNAD